MTNENQFLKNKNITEENIRFYHEYGYLVARGLFDPAEIEELKRDTAKIFRGEYGHTEGMLPAIENESDVDVLKKYVAIHFPHKISPVIKNYLFHQAVTEVLTKIVSPNLKCMQSMLFVKGPGKAGQSWHQDEFYIPTRDKSLIGVWIAIDDASVENGCLWVIPGSQKSGFIMPRIDNDSKEYADVDTVDVSGYPEEQVIPLEAKKGDVVFFNGYLLHSSLRNKTKDNFRTALVNHYMSAESMLPWDQDGKFPLTADLRDIVLVAGKDPYAYRPIADVNQPYLRPEVLKIVKN
ncbi:phytanoyl-CoA dioxygenase family protein [Dyadobacter diqingensis]|uniref:phytanoyl-CoA dioxygenase family protein n=1 Tax=Dyadobacter diqingensis TaxID=2938121 RepID=UPI0020C2C9FF|nr:phytanoyl-CoA dioxygenase family protein [Dyadobacter diqingensis]